MVRVVKLSFPYVQLSFLGWVIWTTNASEWQTVASILLLAWLALGITALRVALAATARAFIAERDTRKMLHGLTRVTKPRR